ncbi:Phenoxybenzoate dioxygenase subunit beta [compost metagenome]
MLIAGGIGITPLWSMAQHLSGKGTAWELHYFARSHRNAALLERMQGDIERGDIHLLLARDVETTVSDIRALFGADAGERHYYCCGPSGMIEAYKALSQGIDGHRIHFESFVPLQEAATAGGYEVVLAKTGKTLSMEAGKSILDALGEAGVEVMNSCREGICGACEVRVIEGTPDHRDSILSDAEKQANRTMFVCCSGSRSPRLVLDL